MLTATSDYLNRPLRTLEQARFDAECRRRFHEYVERTSKFPIPRLTGVATVYYTDQPGEDE